MATDNRSEYADLYDEMLEWLDDSRRSHDAWQVVEEAARTHSMGVREPNNLHLAGRVYGMATALQVMYDHGTGNGEGFYEGNVNVWVAFIEDFAESNYENGERIC